MYKVKVNEDLEFNISEDKNGLSVNGQIEDPDVKKIGNNSYHIIHKGKSYNVSIVSREGKNFIIKVDGNKYELKLEDRYDLLLDKLGLDLPGLDAIEDLHAPMPGLVLEILVTPGQEIKKDTPLMVLEAMKMENVLKAPADAVIGEIQVEKQQPVDKNQLLITFEK